MNSPRQHSHDHPEDSHPRWSLIGKVIKFQAKLLVDGLRDLVMSPISLAAAVAGLVFEPRDPERYFRRLLKVGQRSEHWINLFGDPGRIGTDPGIDDLFGQLENRLVEQYEAGGATASAKRAVDRSLDRVHRGLDRLRERVNVPTETDDQP